MSIEIRIKQIRYDNKSDKMNRNKKTRVMSDEMNMNKIRMEYIKVMNKVIK